MEINSKKALAIQLSKLKSFEKPEVRLEQYPTDSEVAADVLWNSGMIGEISGKVIVDLGAGTGILGLGALLMGAKKVFFVESEVEALDLARRNYEKLKSEGFNIGDCEFLLMKINDFNKKCDLVIQNPPFGTKVKHADKEFLEKAFQLAPVVYSFHKENTLDFVEKTANNASFYVTHHWTYEFPIKAVYSFHTRKIHRILVGVWRFQKKY